MKPQSIVVQFANGARKSFSGREAWALRCLIQAGSGGLTTIDRPAPRWSHYIFKLRQAGIVISTAYEDHGGAYPGHHGRYRLETSVTVVEEVQA